MSKRVRTPAYLTQHTRDRVKHYAKVSGVSVSHVVEEALKSFLPSPRVMAALAKDQQQEIVEKFIDDELKHYRKPNPASIVMPDGRILTYPEAISAGVAFTMDGRMFLDNEEVYSLSRYQMNESEEYTKKRAAYLAERAK